MPMTNNGYRRTARDGAYIIKGVHYAWPQDVFEQTYEVIE